MPERANATSPRRNPLGWWFCGLAVLGLVRATMKLLRDASAASDVTTWIWFGGSLLLLAIGVWLLTRRLRAKN